MSTSKDPVTRVDTMPRRVQAELLDELPGDDPRAVRSRRDLQRINSLIGSTAILLRALDDNAGMPPTQLVELGSGDGRLLLQVARARCKAWPGVQVSLVDRQPCVSAETLSEFHALGWPAQVLTLDVFDWLAQAQTAPVDVLLANLFVHHFEGERLQKLLDGIARSCRGFVCNEPRRSRLALFGSHLLGLIGCNAVTRHDAVLSVHAGFRDAELSALWPRTASAGWQLHEREAGIFGHLLVATQSAP
ncbi:MAG: hypothetical protein ABIW30_07805 [Arenimonas sp.]